MSFWNTLRRLLFGGAAATPAPVVPSAPPPKHMRVTTWQDRPEGHRAVAAVDAQLQLDSAEGEPPRPPVVGVIEPEPDGTPRLCFTLPPDAQFGWHARLAVRFVVDADPVVTDVVTYDVTLASNFDVDLPRARPPLPRVVSNGRFLFTDDGRPLRWFGITAFQLLEMVAHGRFATAETFLQLAAQNRCMPRVLCMASNLFSLTPQEGLAALPAFLDAARRAGCYVELVLLADTKSYPDLHLEDFVSAVGAIAAQHGNAILEIGNEVLPIHPTQSDRLTPDFLHGLADLIPPEVPVSLGSTHADRDEDRGLVAADYVTAHMDRSDADNGWKWVRHTNELGWIADDCHVYAINDEPRRDDLTPGKHFALAFLCRVIRDIGTTFHYRGGLFGQPPTGDELRAWNAAHAGFYMVDEQWHGDYKNAGQTGSPVKGFEGALRVYSSVRGNEAWCLALDAAAANIEWADGWRAQERAALDGARVFYATRG